MNLSGKRVLVTGARGFVGRHLVPRLQSVGCDVIGEAGRTDLRDWAATWNVFALYEPQIVLHLAAVVGGIGFNREHPYDCAMDNMRMGCNVLEACRTFGVDKVIVAGSACAYPKFAPVPFQEDDLWDGYPEETNAPYGLAKRAVLTLGQALRQQHGVSVIHLLCANLYGPGDDFSEEKSHVIPALIRRFCDAADSGAESVTVWGTGTPSREFLYVEDAAEAYVAAAERYDSPEPVNVGVGREVTIRDLVGMIAAESGYRGEIEWDASKPDGQPRRALSVTRAHEAFGFTAQMPLENGIARTVSWYRSMKERT